MVRKIKVFVTDASYKHTLAAVRSLGRKQIEVIAGSSSRYAQAFYSKYCKKKLIYPPLEEETRFIRVMDRLLKTEKVDVLLPIGYQATAVLSKYQEQFSKRVQMPIAQQDSLRIAGNKNETLEFAEQLGLRIPRFYRKIDEINQFPVVIKGSEGAGQVWYATSKKDLAKQHFDGQIIQEYIPGEGYGFFALYNHGKLRAFFMHRRIREYPITGGPSTAAESTYDPNLKQLGMKLLEGLNWHGVAMVEFKKDRRDGKYTLMEVNPKFWGSLDLAISSGVDFPYLTAKMAMDGDIQPVYSYQVGNRFQWLFPDELLHLAARPQSVGSVLADFANYHTKSNVTLRDIKPTMFQLFYTAWEFLTRIRKGELRYPHGIPSIGQKRK
ncbi:MAG: ATP-grasp domain-containing protein [Candidatus Hermodarchaeota archaeon]|nr:ATP-grasp domain-containing protein [Candidatus Hermodarchaeota archaeon]